MHILMAILGVIGVVSVVLYRLSYTYSAGKELAEDSKALWRRTKWKLKRRHDLLDTLTDPREVATVLMVETAKLGGEMTVSQKAKIAQLMRRHFEIDDAEADDMMVAAAFKTRDVADVENVLVRILKPVRERLTDKEKLDLVQMMHEVAKADGKLDPYQDRFIGVVKDKLVGPTSRNYG